MQVVEALETQLDHHLRLAESQFLLVVVELAVEAGTVTQLNLVYQVQVALKVVVEILAHPKLVLTIQEIRMTHLHQLDGDIAAHLVQVVI